jgi:hypothetical protein
VGDDAVGVHLRLGIGPNVCFHIDGTVGCSSAMLVSGGRSPQDAIAADSCLMPPEAKYFFHRDGRGPGLKCSR